MADVTQHASWIRRLSQRRVRRQTDWADLGTAFGLDMSLQASAETAGPGGAPAADSKPAPRRWWQRRSATAGTQPP